MSNTISRLRRVLEDRYRVERELGRGGMAEIYLADDLKHGRKVALKVLKPELAAVVGAERFLTEIRTTANLQHPHILPLYDSGEADGLVYYVMPYVQGESLRERMDRERQLPVQDAVRIATSVAEALDFAHRKGVIHRDIKPANVLLQDGKPVVSDFGIALAVGAAGSGRLTETGLSIGTPHYMSPEQATGDQHIGPATDTYALGCVLYEMLVGEPPFAGSTPQAVLGRIISGEVPSAQAERSSVPYNVDAAIAKALQRLPADRFGTAVDFAKALQDAGFRGPDRSSARGSPPGRWPRLAVTAGATVVALAVAYGWTLLSVEAPRPVARLELTVPEGVDLAVSSRRPVVSPDGASFVFVGTRPDGSTELWHRPLDRLSVTPIPGTTGAEGPEFSPDGTAIAFVVRTSPPTIRTVSLTGSSTQTVLMAESINETIVSLAWGPDDMIYFTHARGHISRVAASGGEPEDISSLRQGDSFHAPSDVLPTGRGLLFLRSSDEGIRTDSVAALSLSGDEQHTLFAGRRAQYLPTGHVVFGTPDGDLLAAPFDPDRLEATGPPRPLLDGIANAGRGPLTGFGQSLFTLSNSGVLAYVPQSSRLQATYAQFVWVDRAGTATPVDSTHVFEPPRDDFGWSLSPAGDRVAVTHLSDENVDIWIKQLPTGPFERLTFGDSLDLSPTWTPDGRSLTYTAGDPALLGAGGPLLVHAADGGGAPEVLVTSDPAYIQPEWSRDGVWIVFRSIARVGTGSRDILGLRPGLDTVVVPLVASPQFSENGPALSPDGRWLAYSSNASGQEQVYVRPFPNVDSARVTVSIDGGWSPAWASGRNELFFASGDGHFMVAQFEVDPDFRVVRRQPLFPLGRGFLIPDDIGDDFYEVRGDDQAFLMARPAGRPSDRRRPVLVVVQNFDRELERLVPN